MKKIQVTSRLLHLLFKVLCWTLPFVFAYFILFNLESLLNWGVWPFISLTQIHEPLDFSLVHRLAILAIQLLPLSITVIIFNKLSTLFGLYEKGNLFEEENIQLIKSISVYMLLGELVQLIYQPLITVALSFNNPPGERFLSLTLGSTNIATVITAFIILVASWILKEANRLQSDSLLTI